jgi:hypothetical protein
MSFETDTVVLLRVLIGCSCLLVPACAGSSDDAAPGPGPVASAAPNRFFPAGAHWYRDVSTAPLDPESPRVI